MITSNSNLSIKVITLVLLLAVVIVLADLCFSDQLTKAKNERRAKLYRNHHVPCALHWRGLLAQAGICNGEQRKVDQAMARTSTTVKSNLPSAPMRYELLPPASQCTSTHPFRMGAWIVPWPTSPKRTRSKRHYHKTE
jgi:hypothetical protein